MIEYTNITKDLPESVPFVGEVLKRLRARVRARARARAKIIA